MADLQCVIRSPGCLKTARFVCHHCGRPLCSHCDKVMVDRQFAKSDHTKKYPKTHHCPDCYHPTSTTLFLGVVDLAHLKRLLRQIFS